MCTAPFKRQERAGTRAQHFVPFIKNDAVVGFWLALEGAPSILACLEFGKTFI